MPVTDADSGRFADALIIATPPRRHHARLQPVTRTAFPPPHNASTDTDRFILLHLHFV